MGKFRITNPVHVALSTMDILRNIAEYIPLYFGVRLQQILDDVAQQRRVSLSLHQLDVVELLALAVAPGEITLFLDGPCVWSPRGIGCFPMGYTQNASNREH